MSFMIAREIMTSAPVTISPRATVGQALRLLQTLDLRHLPVVDDGRLVGMLSDRDFRTALGPGFLDGTASADALHASVASLMTAQVVAVFPETDIVEIIDRMIGHGVGALPVTAEDSDDLLGIVSYVDVLKAARDRL
jgi:acetoin utilization protein AcuB